MSDTKSYTITIDCENEQDAQAANVFMQALKPGAFPLWFYGKTAAEKWETHADTDDMKLALALFAEADRRYQRVSIQSWIVQL